MSPRRDTWLVAGIALIVLAGFLVLRPSPDGGRPEASGDAAPARPARTVPVDDRPAATTTSPLLEGIAPTVDRVLADSGNAEVVDPSDLSDLPRSVVKVLTDRRAVLTLPEEAP